MKVGIDISQTVFLGTGVAVYTQNLIDNLLKIDQKNNYVFFGSSLRRREKGFWPIPPIILEILWNRLHIFPVENFIGPVDVFHSSDWTQPPAKARKVTTIHDLLIYKFPEYSHPKTEFRVDVFAPSPNIVASQKRRLEWVKKECDMVIAISESTKRDIMNTLGIPENKIQVIYEAVGESFKNYKKIRRGGKPYILAVGTREPRKNLERLTEAFQKIRNKNVDLVIAGKYGWGDDNSKFKIQNLKFLGYVTQEKLPELYANAEAFIFPSLYEGFGIPVLEAMTVGCPVITSNVSSLPEVGGKAAVYVDPLNINDIKEKIDYVLNLKEKERKVIIDKGLKQAAKFSWEKTARETVKIYQSLL